MRIAYDITQTGKDKAGCGYFAYSLIHALAEADRNNEYLLLNSFGPYYWDGEASPKSIGLHQANFKAGLRHVHGAEVQHFWRAIPPNVNDVLGKPDIVHANNFYCPAGLLNTRIIYTLYDLNFTEHPEWTTTANHSICFEGVYNASLYADGILAISNYSRDHFLRTFPYYPREKTRVIYPASRYASIQSIERPSRLPVQASAEKFWLCVGTIEPRKNHLGLLRAYARYKALQGDVPPLVHAGGSGWLMDDFKEQIHKLNLQNDVITLGYVDDVTLQWLYQNCFAFVYPSLFEGFGMPVLEAMSLGAAVITSDTTSLPEVAGDAALLINPLDDEALAHAMLRLGDDVLRRNLKIKAIAQAACFSWQDSANATLQMYREFSTQNS